MLYKSFKGIFYIVFMVILNRQRIYESSRLLWSYLYFFQDKCLKNLGGGIEFILFCVQLGILRKFQDEFGIWFFSLNRVFQIGDIQLLFCFYLGRSLILYFFCGQLFIVLLRILKVFIKEMVDFVGCKF